MEGWITVESMPHARALIKEYDSHELNVAAEWSDSAYTHVVKVSKKDLLFLCKEWFRSQNTADDELRVDRRGDTLFWLPCRSAE